MFALLARELKHNALLAEGIAAHLYNETLIRKTLE
jgi:hypothetical protein